MNREWIMEWIDNADARELKNPPSLVKEYLARDRECWNYYQVSLKLLQPVEEVDLWKRFRHAQIESEGQKSNRTLSGILHTKWLLGVTGAVATIIIFLVFVVNPFSVKQDPEYYTDEMYYDSLEMTLEIANDFGTGSLSEMNALDYYYEISKF